MLYRYRLYLQDGSGLARPTCRSIDAPTGIVAAPVAAVRVQARSVGVSPTPHETWERQCGDDAT